MGLEFRFFVFDFGFVYILLYFSLFIDGEVSRGRLVVGYFRFENFFFWLSRFLKRF